MSNRDVAGLLKIPAFDLFESTYKGAIFDIDGTLLDSVSMWSDIDTEFLGRRGFEVPDDYIQNIGHLKFNQIAEYTIQRFDLTETPEQLIAEWRSMAREAYATTVGLKPGAYEYLAKLKKQGVRIAIATALERELFEIALKHTGIYDFIEVFATIYDLKCEKGTPDVYVHAAAEMGLSVDECIVFEDIVAGVRGAKAAKSETKAREGFTVVGIYNKAADNIAEELSELCDYFIRDFTDLH